MKKIIAILTFVLLLLAACGEDRSSNGVPPQEIIDDSRQTIGPESGNGKVNAENDEGMPDTNELNDPSFEGLKGYE